MKKVFLTCLLAAALTSCHTGKEAALNDLRQLTEQIEQNAADYDLDDWRRVQKKYERIDHRLSNHDYSAAQSREIGQLKGRSLGAIAKGLLSRAGNRFIDAVNQIQSIVDGIQRALEP